MFIKDKRREVYLMTLLCI